MKITAVVSFFAAALSLANALAPSKNVKSPIQQLQKGATGAFAAAAIASSALLHAPPPADATVASVPFVQTSSQLVAEKEIRQGFYREYEVDVPDQVYDDARSTFKSAKETKSNKGKYTALLAILIVGSFIVPMAQYFWYVRDDDSTDKFFASQNSQQAKVPEEPPKKKGWF